MVRNALYIGSMRPLMVNNFSGGWNPRDAPSEVADTESPDCLNVVSDERGGVVGRLGYARLGSGTTLTGSPSNIFESKALGFYLVQDGAVLRKTTDFITFSDAHTFTTSARCAMVDFNNKVVIVHPVDKVATYDGSTWTAVATSPAGSCIAAWQNKVWVSGDSGAVARVYACNNGDPTTWTLASDYNDIRENDGLAVVALGAGQGMDVSGRPGLLAFKNGSVHRINESASGEGFGQYTTLTTKAGAAGPLAVAAAPNGLIGFVGEAGIFATNGVDPPSPVSAKLSPFFTPVELNFAQHDKWAAGVYKDRLVFSVTRGASTSNNFTLDFSPTMGWVFPHNFGMTAYCSPAGKLYGASPTAGKVFEVFKGGNDDGTAISARFSTRWFIPSGLYKNRFRHLRVEGRGNFDLYERTDYDLGDGLRNSFVPVTSGDEWGHFQWGHGVWSTAFYEDTRDFYPSLVGHSTQFQLKQTYSTSVFSPSLLGDGSAAETGPFALYSIMLDYIRLGYG